MSRIRSKDTKPEIRARSAVYALGQRFRINVSDLPGKPDLSNKARRWAIFVHGCFWHSHNGCRLASKPRSNLSYWSEKLARTQLRDADHERALRDLGFDVLILWECDTRNDAKLQQVVAAFFCSADGMRAVAPTSGQIRTINHAAIDIEIRVPIRDREMLPIQPMGK